MDCKTAAPLLNAYLDAELDRADARELETHVDGCADCRAELARLGELRSALRDGALRRSAPQALRDRIRATGVSKPVRNRPALWRYAAGFAFAFLLGAALMHVGDASRRTDPAEAQLARDLFASHWRALAAASPVDVVSSDRHTVKPWFAGKIADAPRVQDFADQGFPLVGGRIDYVGSQRVAVLVYRHGQHLIDVFVLPDGAAAAASMQRGYAIEPVRLAGRPAAIVSDMDAAERAHFESLLARDGGS